MNRIYLPKNNSFVSKIIVFFFFNLYHAPLYSQSLLPVVGSSSLRIITANSSVSITDFGLLPFGNYLVLVKEGLDAPNENCSITSTPFTISESVEDFAIFSSVLQNANCLQKGIISVKAEGGTAPYQYQIISTSSGSSSPSFGPVPPPPPSEPTTWESYNTFSAEAGDYNVFVKDTHGCVKQMRIYLPKDPEPQFNLTLQDYCAPEGNFVLKATETIAGIMPYYGSINGSIFSPVSLPLYLTNQNSGNYTLTIKDWNGCTSTQNISVYESLSLSVKIIQQPSCGTNDGKIVAISTGGSGNFEYKIDGVGYVSNPIFTGLSPGNHTFSIRDTTTLCEKTSSVNLEIPSPVTGFNLEVSATSCTGGNDGSIKVSIISTDNPVYQFRLNGGAFQQSNLFSNLTAGSYSVEVISGRGCKATNTIFVPEPDAISVPPPTVVEFGCSTTNSLDNASIKVAGVTGGSGTYLQYEFLKNGTRVQFSSNPTYIEMDVTGGNYEVIVYDSNGCFGKVTTTIRPALVLDSINKNVIHPISCNVPEEVQFFVTTIGASPTYLEYTLSPISGSLKGTSIPSNSTGIFSGLTVGEYLITIQNPQTNCSIQEIYTVNEPNTFTLNLDSITDVSCFGGNNGSASLSMIDTKTTTLAGDFSYILKDSLGNSIQSGFGKDTVLLSGLKADTYTFTATLTHFPFCNSTKQFVIVQSLSPLVLNEKHNEITCVVGNNDGKIIALPQGGWPDFYEFKWEKEGLLFSDWNIENTASQLVQGNYTLFVRDAKGCVADKQVELRNPTPIIFNASSNTTLLHCFGDRTAIISTLNVSGGQGSNYWYTLNETSPNPTVFGSQTSNEFKNLGAGIYNITVNDNWSCTTTSSAIEIKEPNNVDVTLSLQTAATCMIPAQLDLQISGGTPPYTYSTDNLVFSPFLSPILTGSIGTNHYFIKDSKGCGSYQSNAVVVEAPQGLSIAIDTTFAKVNCTGDATASILAIAQGGLGNYTYILLDEFNTVVRPVQTSGLFSGLAAGKYKVKLTSNDCIPVESALINVSEPASKLQPTYWVTDVLCPGAKNGTIKITTSGGTGVIKQALSPYLSQFTESNLFENLSVGSYDVLVQDVLGCYEKKTISISEPANLEAKILPSTIVQELCLGDQNARFSIAVTGGKLPYSVVLDNPSGAYVTGSITQSQFDFTHIAGGIHTVYIQDANQCTLSYEVKLNKSVFLNPIAFVNYDCVNNLQHNLVKVSLDSSISNYSVVEFALDGGVYQSSNVFSNLSPGDHFVRVKHNNGCVQDTPVFTILKKDPLALSLKLGGLNEIIAVANGGGGNYQFTFNGEFNSSNPNYVYYKTQDFLVTVQDANGCKVSVTQKFNYIDICVLNYFTPNADGINDTWAPGCIVNYTKLTFTVVDRYGREIGTYHYGESWDGKYKGEELPSGDYWYVIHLKDPKEDREFVGHFTLYR